MPHAEKNTRTQGTEVSSTKAWLRRHALHHLPAALLPGTVCNPPGALRTHAQAALCPPLKETWHRGQTPQPSLFSAFTATAGLGVGPWLLPGLVPCSKVTVSSPRMMTNLKQRLDFKPANSTTPKPAA